MVVLPGLLVDVVDRCQHIISPEKTGIFPGLSTWYFREACKGSESCKLSLSSSSSFHITCLPVGRKCTLQTDGLPAIILLLGNSDAYSATLAAVCPMCLSSTDSLHVHNTAALHYCSPNDDSVAFLADAG